MFPPRWISNAMAIIVLASIPITNTQADDWFDDFESGVIGEDLGTLGYEGFYVWDSTASIEPVGVDGSKGVYHEQSSDTGLFNFASRRFEQVSVEIGQTVELSVEFQFELSSVAASSFHPMVFIDLLKISSSTTLLTLEFGLDSTGQSELDSYAFQGYELYTGGFLTPSSPLSELGIVQAQPGVLSDFVTIKMTATKIGEDEYQTTFQLVDVHGNLVKSQSQVMQLDGVFAPGMLEIRFGNLSNAYRSMRSMRFDSFRWTENSATLMQVAPQAITVTRGHLASNSDSELDVSDNIDLSIRRSNSDVQSITQVEAESECPIPFPSSIELLLESSVFGRSQVTQQLEVYDFENDLWVEIDERTATRFTDSTVEVELTGDLTRFISPIASKLRARVTHRSSVNRQLFSANIDQLVWRIHH